MSEIIGKIILLKDTEKITETFSKREIVVETDEQFKQKILIQFVKDKCNILDKYKVGDNVKVSYNLQGKEWVNPQGETKYFNSIQGWNISKVDSNANVKTKEEKPFETTTNFKEEEHDGLPF